ncbi:MAG: potassium channel family protein [Dehalococcoidia bacterium]
MTSRRRVIIAGLLVLAMLSVGTVGYALIDGRSPFDAFFETIVTLATAGIQPDQSATVAGRLLTIALLLVGGGVLFYTVGVIARLTLEGEFAEYFGGQRMRSRIEHLENHFIICGLGRVGAEVAAEFAARSLPFVVIDSAADAVQRATKRDYLALEGDATLDETLEAAGVRRARCLVAASDSDANNTYITLSAKTLNPNIFVVTRTAQPENERKLRQAGADRVISPYAIAGRHIALSAVQPLLLDFMQTSDGTGDLVVAQLYIEAGSDFEGKPIADVLGEASTTTVLGLRRKGGIVEVGPPPSERVAAGDELIVVGSERELEQIDATRNSLKLSPRASAKG